jgi:hypothetical protein
VRRPAVPFGARECTARFSSPRCTAAAFTRSLLARSVGSPLPRVKLVTWTWTKHRPSGFHQSVFVSTLAEAGLGEATSAHQARRVPGGGVRAVRPPRYTLASNAVAAAIAA